MGYSYGFDVAVCWVICAATHWLLFIMCIYMYIHILHSQCLWKNYIGTSAFTDVSYSIADVEAIFVSACTKQPRKQSSWGQHGANLGPVGPIWAPCWPQEPCYQGSVKMLLLAGVVEYNFASAVFPRLLWNARRQLSPYHFIILWTMYGNNSTWTSSGMSCLRR